MTMFILAVILIVIDQIIKILAFNLLKPVGSVVLINKILSLTYVENRGAAFGIMQNSRWFFILITIAAVFAIFYYTIKYKPQSKLLKCSLSMILAGAAGNLIDRVFRGFVVDMIEITFIDYPVFNFADCCIVIGAVILAVYIIFVYKEEPKGTKNND